MPCSTCGAPIPRGRLECTTCGASAPANGTATEVTAEPACGRCGYRAQGLGYFSKGSHLAVLLLLGVAALPLALIFLAFRYGHEVCPRCGASWGKHGERARFALRGGGGDVRSAGSPRQSWAVLLAVLAVMLLTGGVLGGFEAVPLAFGAGAGVGAWLLHLSAGEERARRREGILATLARPVLRLAADRGGRLTVTEVAADLGWTLKRAERVLQSLDDGFRVSSEVTDQGIIVFEFRELMHAPRRIRQD